MKSTCESCCCCCAAAVHCVRARASALRALVFVRLLDFRMTCSTDNQKHSLTLEFETFFTSLMLIKKVVELQLNFDQISKRSVVTLSLRNEIRAANFRFTFFGLENMHTKLSFFKKRHACFVF